MIRSAVIDDERCETCASFVDRAVNEFGSSYAAIYDSLTQDLGYYSWVDYVTDLAHERGCCLTSVLDLGCGTGSFTLAAMSRGLRVTAIDSSSWMLHRLQEKMVLFPAAERNCQIVRAKLSNFQLAAELDAAVGFFDTFNYLIGPNEFSSMVRNTRSVLRDGGMFVFDLNTHSAYVRNVHQCVMTLPSAADSPTRYSTEGRYCERHALYSMQLSIMATRPANLLAQELHVQRCYSYDYVVRCLARHGFTDIRCFRAFSTDEPSVDDDRFTFVATSH